ncbi:MAG: hypothetical protein R3321_12825, partial [Nitrososphaeraceae archaeon]|nr:hypothetical protein [Nitrososphaeraceae archaeon]
MRTWNNKKGHKIVITIYKHEPNGISFRKLAKISEISKNGLEKWLVRLKDLYIVRKITKKGVHL